MQKQGAALPLKTIVVIILILLVLVVVVLFVTGAFSEIFEGIRSYISQALAASENVPEVP